MGWAAAGDDGEDKDQALEAGRRLFALPCRFLAGAAGVDQLPDLGLPEVAFAGRSNVGKSSLINALTGRKALARTARAPGRTRQINFFVLGGALVLADLPGFGYARAPKHEIARWTALVAAYLRERTALRRACLLIDSRHGIKDGDRRMMAILDAAAVSYQAVLTKGDKLDAGALAARLGEVGAELSGHPAAHPSVLATSAPTGEGIAELRAALAALSGKLPQTRLGFARDEQEE